MEQNPLRARLVRRAEDWAWSSLRWSLGLADVPAWAAPSWLARPADWLAAVHAPQAPAELAAVRQSIARGRPLGTDGWVKHIAPALGLESSLRPRGRPRKEPEK